MKIIKACLGNKIHCELCGYKEHIEILTRHHIYPRRLFPNQALLGRKRKDRYKILCPNCHTLVEKGIKKLEIKDVNE